MDFHLPLTPDDTLVPRSHAPVRLWMLVTLIVAVLGLAIAAAGAVTDTRDFAQRHASVPRGHAL